MSDLPDSSFPKTSSHTQHGICLISLSSRMRTTQSSDQLIFSVKGHTVNILDFVGYTFCHNYSTLQLQNTSSHRQYTNGLGCLLIKLYLQKQAAEQILSVTDPIQSKVLAQVREKLCESLRFCGCYYMATQPIPIQKLVLFTQNLNY